MPSFKEVRVRTSTNEEDLIVVYIVDKEPIRLDMAFPQTVQVAGEPVRLEEGREDTIAGERSHDHDQLILVFASSLLSLEISPKFAAFAHSSHRV
jgi:hypothetical protein